MGRVLDGWCASASDMPELFLCTWGSAEKMLAQLHADERAAGEPETDREVVAEAILAALEVN